jgi:threonine synthase
MKFYSTREKSPVVNFEEALFTGQAVDGGLYMPKSLPHLYGGKLSSIKDKSYGQFVFDVARPLFCEEIADEPLYEIIQRAYKFSPALKTLERQTLCLELFHGPTLSFKDFGARFMAQAMCYFHKKRQQEITILVATSGDTGSAVARAYHRIQGIRVVLLYPSGKVSGLQEKQLTTIGDNVLALEVEGTFDDCQALVKKAFADQDLKKRFNLTSANSINIGRLLPQSFYYGWAISTLLDAGYAKINVCVPSGNLGNLCGGLFAQQSGLPVNKFIAAVNANRVVPDYLYTGTYRPRPSVVTLSNAMDVGNPSNWERIIRIFRHAPQLLKRHLWSTSVSDDKTREMIKAVHSSFSYIIDPHTAVGFAAVERYRQEMSPASDETFLILSTAHPGKFHDIVSGAIEEDFPLPEELQKALELPKNATKIPADFSALTDLLSF